MSKLRELAKAEISRLDARINEQRSFITEHTAELEAAQTDLAQYCAQRQELIDFLDFDQHPTLMESTDALTAGGRREQPDGSYK